MVQRKNWRWLEKPTGPPLSLIQDILPTVVRSLPLQGAGVLLTEVYCLFRTPGFSPHIHFWATMLPRTLRYIQSLRLRRSLVAMWLPQTSLFLFSPSFIYISMQSRPFALYSGLQLNMTYLFIFYCSKCPCFGHRELSPFTPSTFPRWCSWFILRISHLCPGTSHFSTEPCFLLFYAKQDLGARWPCCYWAVVYLTCSQPTEQEIDVWIPTRAYAHICNISVGNDLIHSKPHVSSHRCPSF